MSSITVNIDELASGIADDLQMTDEDIADMRDGKMPDNWSNAIIDRLEYDYELETLLVEKLVKEK